MRHRLCGQQHVQCDVQRLFGLRRPEQLGACRRIVRLFGELQCGVYGGFFVYGRLRDISKLYSDMPVGQLSGHQLI